MRYMLLCSCLASVAWISACSDPQCSSSERRVGDTCVRKNKAANDVDASVDSVTGDGAVNPVTGDGATSSVAIDDGAVDGQQLAPTADADGAVAAGPGEPDAASLQDDAGAGDSGSANTEGDRDGCAPGNEVCDGVDNDCDGQIDEQLPNACGGTECAAQLSNKGMPCTAGASDCQGSGTWECDPAANNNALRCTAKEKDKNECGVSCGPLSHALGATCSNGGQGACAASGKYACFGGEAVCNAPPPTPGPEVCDGVDNDCDGQADEGLTNLACGGSVCGADLSKKGTTCTAGVGDCQGSGTWECDPAANNNALRCTATEKEKNACRVSCAPLSHPFGATCSNGAKGACAASGTYACFGGDTVCNAPSRAPGTESCDGIDNDCDGDVDEGTKNECGLSCGSDCPPPSACRPNGQVEAGEQCDPLAAGWSDTTCNSSTCRRRPYATCASQDECEAQYPGSLCNVSCRICVPISLDETPGAAIGCPRIPGIRASQYFLAQPFCMITCKSDAECPSGLVCNFGTGTEEGFGQCAGNYCD